MKNMSCKSANKTYRSRKMKAGQIDPKEILQTVNDHNTLFDAFSIRNIRKYKKDCLIIDLPYSSKKKRRKRNVKLSCKINLRKKASDDKNEVLQEVAPQYSPDKSLHVKRISDPFDKLFANNENVEVQKCDMDKFDPRINLSSDDSSSFNKSLEKRETNGLNSPPESHLSTLKDALPVLTLKSSHCQSGNLARSYDPSKNMQQNGNDTSQKVFSHNFEIDHVASYNENNSIDNMVKNVDTFRAVNKMSPFVSVEQLECDRAMVSTPLRPQATSSTPFLKINRKSIFNISPICRNLKMILLDNDDQHPNQVAHEANVKSVNKNNIKKTKSKPIAKIEKHLPNNLKTSVDLFESTLDDCNDSNCSESLKEASFINKTEDEINYEDCCNLKHVLHYSNNVEDYFSKSVNEQGTHYPTVPIERLRNSIFQNYIGPCSGHIISSEKSDMNNDNYSESKCTRNDSCKSNLKIGNPKVHLRRLRESILQRHLQMCTKDVNANKLDANSLKNEKDLNFFCPTVHIDRLPNSILQKYVAPYSGDLSSEKFECSYMNNDNYSESKYTHSNLCKSNFIRGNPNVHIMRLRKSVLQQHLQANTVDITTTKFDSNCLKEISQKSIDDEEVDFVKIEQSEFKKNGYQISLEKCTEDKEGTSSSLLRGSLFRRAYNNQTLNIDSSIDQDLSDEKTCNSEENSLHFLSMIMSQRSPCVPINNKIHVNNANKKEKLSTDKKASSPILNMNWKWQVSHENITSQTLNNSKNDGTEEGKVSSSSDIRDLSLASDTLSETRLLNKLHVGTRLKMNDSGIFKFEKRNAVNYAHDLSQHAVNQLTYGDFPKMSAISPNKREHLTSQNKDDFKFIKPSNRNSIILQPGKKWERSLSIMRRLTLKNDETITEIDSPAKGRRYRQSIANLINLQQNRDSVLMQCAGPKKKDSIDSHTTKSQSSTIRVVMEHVQADFKTSGTTLEEEIGFLSESCNDTFIDLSKLSISNVDNSSPLLEKIVDVSDRITSRDVVLRRCNQTDCLPFDECYTDAKLKNCRKIGEGVYGEVFLYRGEDGRARVMKVVPVDGKLRVNGELQKNFDEILSEIIIAMELSALRAPIDDLKADAVSQASCQFEVSPSIENATDTFNGVLAVNCVYGRYPARLLDLWQLYDESRGSENDSPTIFDEQQQYVVLELANGGQDLESFQFNNAEQAYAVFYQVAFALAVAEEVYQFEHRDLHWGNVLCTPTDEKFATYVLRGATYRLPRKGVCATIIDYTLSRVSLPLAGATTQATLYNDLGADPTLFEAEGDYQFDIYRLMRERNSNAWKEFEPYTNILWLHYLVDKMITALRYNRVSTKIHKHYIGKLKELKGKILSFESTLDFVLNDNEI